MGSIRQLYDQGREALSAAGIGEAGLDAWLLLEYVTGVSRAFFLAQPEKGVSRKEADQYQTLIDRRCSHEPVQYITGEAWFMGCRFIVNSSVLIPRQDTELLVEEALKVLEDKSAPVFLDLCTGSGCIGLSILLEREDARAVLTDYSAPALDIARKNSEALGLTGRTALMQGDLFDLPGLSGGIFDLIVTNPPYIATDVISGLMEEVKDFEPLMALDGGRDGLDFYRRILQEAPLFLKDGGWLMAEIGFDQGQILQQMLAEAGFYRISCRKDLAGCDRVVMGKKRG